MSVQPALQRDADLSAELTELRGRMKSLMVDLENAETELRVYRRENGRLKTELKKAIGQHQTVNDLNRVFDYWCQKFSKKKGTKFGEKRQAKVRARMRERFTADELCRAIDGCARFPYQHFAKHVAEPVKGATKRTDLEYICQDEVQVERFIELAELEKPTPLRPTFDAVVMAVTDKFGRDAVMPDMEGDRVVGYWAKCPVAPGAGLPMRVTVEGRELRYACAHPGCDDASLAAAVDGLVGRAA